MANQHIEVWNISERDFPISGTSGEKFRFLLGYAVLAPSRHNSQPWKFHIEDGSVYLYADRSRSLPVVDPDGRELIISCGAALENLLLAVRYFEHSCALVLFPEPWKPDLLARVDLGVSEEPPETVLRLFRAIPGRRTNRLPYKEQPIPPELLNELRAHANRLGVWLHVMEDGAERRGVAELVAEGDCIQQSNSAFRHELGSWLRTNVNTGGDGIPGYALAMGTLPSLVGPLLVGLLDRGEQQAAKDSEAAFSAPATVLLGTDADDMEAWISTGRALERVLLAASAHGIQVSYLNQPVEVPELRGRLLELIHGAGYPQLLLRMGYGETVPPTPRRTVGEVLEERIAAIPLHGSD